MEFTLNVFLIRKLAFIRSLYSESTRPFIATMQKIDDHDAPFDEYDGDPECAEEPFLDEWFDAYYSVETLGACCLCLVHDTLKQFVEEFMRSTGRVVPSGRDSWMPRYKAFFMSEYKIDWNAAPFDMSILEQLALARNELQHSGDLMASHILQGAHHKKKAPKSMFVENIGPDNKMSIHRNNLIGAIEFVESFGTFLLASTSEVFTIRYVSPFAEFRQVDGATTLDLLKQETGE